jgi:hypothetical protein
VSRAVAFDFSANFAVQRRRSSCAVLLSYFSVGPALVQDFRGEIMTDLEKRRAEAIKAYQHRQAKAAQDATEEAERRRQRLVKWRLIAAAIMRVNDNFARQGSPLLFKHCPGELPEPDDTYEYFQIHPIEYLQRYPNTPSDFPVGYLAFYSSENGKASIEASHSAPNIPDGEIYFDDLTENLAEQIASELMIAVLTGEDED